MYGGNPSVVGSIGGGIGGPVSLGAIISVMACWRCKGFGARCDADRGECSSDGLNDGRLVVAAGGESINTDASRATGAVDLVGVVGDISNAGRSEVAARSFSFEAFGRIFSVAGLTTLMGRVSIFGGALKRGT